MFDRTSLGSSRESAERVVPGKVLVMTPEGQLHEAGTPDDWPRRPQLPREVEELAAVLYRTHGYEYGSAMLYPSGAKREREYVTQPAELPMGFTFCLEEEFPELVGRWRKEKPTVEPTREETSLYNAAFMPHLEPPSPR